MLCRCKRLEHLVTQHPEISTWSTDPVALKRAVALLCSSKVVAWKQKLEGMRNEYTQAKWVQSRMHDESRKDHKKLRQELLKMSDRMRDTLEVLVKWEEQRVHYSAFLPPAGLLKGTCVSARYMDMLGLYCFHNPACVLYQHLCYHCTACNKTLGHAAYALPPLRGSVVMLCEQYL